MYETSVINYIKKYAVDVTCRDIYHFGIYTGNSMEALQKLMFENNIKPHNIYGFDSFIGLPAEAPGVALYKDHTKGNFNLIHDDLTIPAIINAIMGKLIYKDITTIIPGYFADVLNHTFADQYHLKPAFYIEIDCDLYISALQALEFMHNYNLIVSGTIIYFDDWGGVTEYKGGESMAWREFQQRYRYKTRILFDCGNGRPHKQKAFKIL